MRRIPSKRDFRGDEVMNEITSAQQQIAVNMTEAELQRNIIDAAQKLGWHIHAERPGRTADSWRTPIQGDPGFPDLILIKGRRILAWELKSEKGKLTLEQEEWLRYFCRAGCRIGIIRPHDWLNGSIEDDLKEGS